VLRIAWFSPLPPIPSGIGDYSYELLPLVAERAEVDVFAPSPGRRRSLVRPSGVASVLDPASFEARAEGYDALFHHLGNNPHNEYVFDAALRHPGVAVFHDFVLHHMLAGAMKDPQKRARYRQLVTTEYGEAGETLFRLASLRLVGDLEQFLFPLNGAVATTARAIVVHSQDVRDRLSAVAPDVPVTVIPHYAAKPPKAVEGINRAEARERLGLPPDGFLVGQFGFLTRQKQPVAVLGGFARFREHRPDAQLLVIGQNMAGRGLMHLITDRGLEPSVRMVGHVDLERLYLYLKAVDVVVNLRYPTAGESSGTVARALSEGRPTIVSNLAAFAELPSDVVLKVEVDGDQEAELAARLTSLEKSPGLRASYEEEARRYAETTLDPYRAADRYLAVAEQSAALADSSPSSR
jgi:glycosyltransferase involved in cell wall biosynthesis